MSKWLEISKNMIEERKGKKRLPLGILKKAEEDSPLQTKGFVSMVSRHTRKDKEGFKDDKTRNLPVKPRQL